MNEKELRETIFNMIMENISVDLNEEGKESEDESMLDIAGQFNIPKDLEFTPSLDDIKAIKDIWGNFEHKPMSDEEKSQLSDRIQKAKLRLKDDEQELEKIAVSLDKQNARSIGGAQGRRMNDIGSSMN